MTDNKHKRSLRNRTSAQFGKLGLAICCLVGLAAPYCSNSRADAQTPQTAKAKVAFFSIPVADPVAPVYAKASNDAYQTGSILKDRYVEVYFKTPDGFCAIRPPYGSFSWINGKFVQQESESTGRVHSPSGKLVPSRVGVESPAASHAVQIGLRPNQKIKIIGKVSLDDGSVWYKISPPPGEFRWIKASSLVQDPALAQLPSKLTLQEDFLKQLEQAAATNDHKLPAASPTTLPEPTRPHAPSPDSTTAPSQFPLPKEFNPLTDANTPNPAARAAEETPDETSEFQKRLDALNKEVVKVVNSRSASAKEFHALRTKVGELRTLATSDSERFLVSAVADSIAKAETANALAQKASFNAAKEYKMGDVETRFGEQETTVRQTPYQTQVTPNAPKIVEAVTADSRTNHAEIDNVVPDGRVVDGKFYPNVPAAGLALDATNLPNGQFINGNFIPEPTSNALLATPQPGATPNASPLVAQSASPPPRATVETPPAPRDSTALNPKSKSDTHKSRLEFAFSGANNPFRREKEAVLATNIDRSKKSAALAKLPTLIPSGAQIIVPPASYDLPNTAQTPRVAKLQTGRLRREDLERVKSEIAEAAIDLQSTTTVEQPNEGALVFKSPLHTTSQGATAKELAASDSNPNASVWKPVKPATGVETIAPLATNALAQTNGAKAGNNKIRQTGSFTPATSKSFEHFDSSGTLVELADATEGAPKYALLAHNGATLAVVAYLMPDRNVSFSQFIGKKVGVKGASGTVQVDGETKKLIIVKSLFLQK